MAQVELNTSALVIALGEAGSLTIDVARLAAHPQVVDYVFQYGLRQMLNDVHAGVTKKVEPDDLKRVEQKLALAQKKLASLMAGEVAQARIGGGDPVAREMSRMAESDLKDQLRRIGKKLGDIDKKVWAEVVAKQVAKGEETYRKAAEAKLAIKAEVAPTDELDIMAMLGE